MVIFRAKLSELSKACSSLAYSTCSSFTNSSPGSTQSNKTSNRTTTNHGAMHKQHDARHGMRCNVWCAMHLGTSEGKWWSRHQLGKPSMPLERWGDFGRNRYKDHRNGCTVCKWQAKQERRKTALNSIIALKMHQETMLQHSNIETKHMALEYRWSSTNHEHWSTASTH